MSWQSGWWFFIRPPALRSVLGDVCNVRSLVFIFQYHLVVTSVLRQLAASLPLVPGLESICTWLCPQMKTVHVQRNTPAVVSDCPLGISGGLEACSPSACQGSRSCTVDGQALVSMVAKASLDSRGLLGTCRRRAGGRKLHLLLFN